MYKSTEVYQKINLHPVDIFKSKLLPICAYSFILICTNLPTRMLLLEVTSNIFSSLLLLCRDVPAASFLRFNTYNA